MIIFEEIKELFKQAVDESENMNEALQRLAAKIYEKGGADMLKRMSKLQRDYEVSVEDQQYCERYEPTYYPEDGST